MIVIMPHATSKCELVADFQIKPCDPKATLKQQIIDRRRTLMDKKYAGMVQKYSEIMPPVLRRQIRYKQAQLADEEFKTKFEQQREDKLVDEPTKRHETDVLEFSNDDCQQTFDDQDDEGNDTAFKDVIRLFREPNSRLYLPKEAYVRINFV